MTDQATEFMNALAADLPEQERMILCGFYGDPHTAGPSAWKPRPWRPGRDIEMPRRWNGYVTVASFGRAGDGSFRRRTETFAAGRALMVDDVGEVGASSAKIDRATLAGMPPSARIRTSPNNEQWWYFLETPERDLARFDGVIRAFISGKLLGADPGMSGVTRVGRLPGFTNAKKAYGGDFRTELLELSERRYSVDDLLNGFNLQINGRRIIKEKLPTEEAIERNRAFMSVYKWLGQRGMLKRAEPDPSGWIPITCPWVHNHTGGVDNGAAIREPAPENDFYGAARCHHGHCADKGWAELTDWINEQSIEELERAANVEEQR